MDRDRKNMQTKMTFDEYMKFIAELFSFAKHKPKLKIHKNKGLFLL